MNALVAACPNHPEVSQGLRECSRCHRSFCTDCTVELGGKTVCAGCKDEVVRELRSGAPDVATTEWFSVGKGKFVAMTLATFGLYTIYWMYQQWVRIQGRSNRSILPWARALFSVFFIYSLVRVMRESLARYTNVSWNPGSVSAVFIVSSLIARLPIIGTFSVLGFLILLWPVGSVLEVTRRSDAPTNEKLTAANWVMLVFGALFWVAYLAAEMQPESAGAGSL